MIYEELKIQLDLNEPIDILKSIGRQTKDKDWFVVCDEGDCHLFDNNGNNIDIKKIKSLYEKIIPKDIKTIIVPDSIKSIGYDAFYDCTNLTSINIPDSVKSIGCDAFFGCGNLKSIIIPNSVKKIESCAFYDCRSLTSIIISNSVKSIKHGAFSRCKNLKTLAFKGKTINQVKSMNFYPWEITDESIIKCIN